MAKGDITPFPLDASQSAQPAARSRRPMSAPSSCSRTTRARPASFSLSGPVARILDPFTAGTSDRDRDMSSPARSSNPAHPAEPTPILTLKLSGPSFLDTVIRDNVSKQPVYIIETVRDLTSIYRLDSRLNEAGKAAAVQWPPSVTASSKGKGRSGKSVQMGSGSWRDAEDLLKQGALGNLASRKFNLPHYPHTLKWKLVPGNAYVNNIFAYSCSTSAVKGNIAVLDAAVLSASPRLRIYETLIPAELARGQQNHSGVPLLLLDYLITTALLLTTTNQEWLDRPAGARIPGSSSHVVQKWLAIIHSRPLPPAVELEKEADGAENEPASPATPFSRRPTSSVWETHTSWSSGSGSGSGSGGSEHVTSPSTPATTPSTQPSAYSFARGGHLSPNAQEDVPPVPPLPSVQQPPQQQIRFQIANPEPTPSYKSIMASAESRTYSPAPADASPAYEPPFSSTHPFAYNADLRPSSSLSMSSGRRPRQLPIPPPLQNSHAPPPPSAHELSRVASLPSSLPFSGHPSLHSSASFANLMPATSAASESDANASGSRSILRRSVRSMRSIPQAPPPPQHTLPLPLPPKLAMEYDRAAGPSHTQTGAVSGSQRRQPHEDELARGMSNLAVSSSNLRSPPFLPQQHLFAQSHVGPDAGAGPSSDASAAHMDAGRVRPSYAHAPRETETESVYEMPPPAYDAIDFSLRVRVPGAPARRGPPAPQ